MGSAQVSPSSSATATINLRHFRVNGVPLLKRLPFCKQYRLNLKSSARLTAGRFTISDNALRARLVDGRNAHIITFGKIADAIIASFRKHALTHPGISDIFCIELDI